jgi:hypothetical protein
MRWCLDIGHRGIDCAQQVCRIVGSQGEQRRETRTERGSMIVDAGQQEPNDAALRDDLFESDRRTRQRSTTTTLGQSAHPLAHLAQKLVPFGAHVAGAQDVVDTHASLVHPFDECGAVMVDPQECVRHHERER